VLFIGLSQQRIVSSTYKVANPSLEEKPIWRSEAEYVTRRREQCSICQRSRLRLHDPWTRLDTEEDRFIESGRRRTLLKNTTWIRSKPPDMTYD
jgi:hypothetical protein